MARKKKKSSKSSRAKNTHSDREFFSEACTGESRNSCIIKIGGTLTVGILLGLAFSNSSLSLEVLATFIAITLVVMNILLTLNVRRILLSK